MILPFILIPFFIIQLSELIDAVVCYEPEPNLFEYENEDTVWHVGLDGLEAKNIISRDVVKVVHYSSF